MNPTGALRARLKARPDTEHEEAILRIVIVALVLAYMGWTYVPSRSEPNGPSELLLLHGLGFALALSVALFIVICVFPAPNRTRRAIGMLVDVGAATFCMFLAGEAGVVVIGVYLFIIFGNGFRYGRASLFACQGLCIVGYASVLLFAPYWNEHQVAGWCLMVALVVLPLYVSTLLKRIEVSRARAEEARDKAELALKECIERQQGNVV